MKQYHISQPKKAQPLQISTVKLSNFDLPLEPTKKSIKRIKHLKTPFSTKREVIIEGILSLPDERYIKSSHQSRQTFLIERYIQKPHQHDGQSTDFSVLAKDKINQLKAIINLKGFKTNEPFLKEENLSFLKEEKAYHFREYKLNRKHNEVLQQPFSLHSRKDKNSPFTKSIKAKKFLSKSMQTRTPSVLSNNEYQSIEVGSQSKYGKIQKLVLLGGAINTKLSRYVNPENNEIHKRSGIGNSYYYNRFIRQTKTPKVSKCREEGDNDYQPWQTFIGDSVFEQNNS